MVKELKVELRSFDSLPSTFSNKLSLSLQMQIKSFKKKKAIPPNVTCVCIWCKTQQIKSWSFLAALSATLTFGLLPCPLPTLDSIISGAGPLLPPGCGMSPSPQAHPLHGHQQSSKFSSFSLKIPQHLSLPSQFYCHPSGRLVYLTHPCKSCPLFPAGQSVIQHITWDSKNQVRNKAWVSKDLKP